MIVIDLHPVRHLVKITLTDSKSDRGNPQKPLTGFSHTVAELISECMYFVQLM